MNGTLAFREPPEGVLAGENVPVENDREHLEQSKVEQVANELKAHPAYSDRSDADRREAARDYLERNGGI